MFATVYFLLLIFATFVITNASHFRGATFSWTPSEDGSSIKIKFRISWRSTSSGNWCNDTVISSGSLIGSSSGDMTCYSGCSGTVGSLRYHCTDYSADDDWSSGRNEVIYRVSARSFSFRFSGSAWIDNLKVGASGSWSILATVDLAVRSDTGRINSSPTVEMTPVLNLQDGCQYKIFLQVGDVDGDIVRCRWAKGDTECKSICNGFLGAILDEEACSITYNPNGNQGLYAAALQIEDFASVVSTTPFSSVPLQFIVKVHSGRCGDIPEFIQPTPDDSSCFAIDVGDKINVTVKARGTQRFNRITTISAVGMVRSSEKKWWDYTWHYIEMSVTWTPTEDDAGQDHTLCFYATDSTGLTSQTRCIKLPVSVSGPTPLRVERVGLTNTWTIIIDKTFARPTEAAYIKVYESLTNTEIISVDASKSSDVVFDPVNRQINVSFNYDFDIEEDYHVTIPSGLVQGFVSCGALSVAVSDTGFWNIEVDCGRLNILDGVVIAPNGTDYPHSVFYVCDIGHDLVGESVRTCTANGTWTKNEPFCNIRDCGNFSIPDNGYVSTSSTVYNTTVDFYCEDGYEMSGNSSMYCEHTAAWSTAPPLCILVDCGHPIYLDNGNVSTPNGTTFGMTAYYSCDLGYDLIGLNERQCQQDKLWSSIRPFCSVKDCGSLLPPVDGTIDIDNTTVGNVVTYECDVGFLLKGDHLRECLHTALWSGSDPTCVVSDCGELQSPLNGNVIANGSTYKSVGIFSCDEGYSFTGNNISECQANGSWSSLGQFCTIVDCGVLPPLKGGLYTYNATTYGETLTALCDDGYDLYGSTVRQCLETGDWNGTTTTCVIKDCGPLTDPANGSVSVADTVYGSVATYSCKTGFEITGGSTLTCQTNGSWSEKPPTCQIKDCGPLPPLANGFVYQPVTTYGSYALYICDKGYHIERNTRRCMSDGNWSNKERLCAFIDCGVPLPPENGDVFFNETVYGSKCFFSCYPGYDLIGINVSVCTGEGFWKNSQTECIIKDCGYPIAPVHGQVQVNKTVYRAEADYVCQAGFELVGSKTITCGEDGLWSETGHYCTLKDCGIPPPPNNGNISYESTTFGSTARYICFTGYEIKGKELVVCGADGFWNITGHDCIKTDCGVLPPLKGGLYTYNATTYGETLTAECSDGYELYGSTVRLCLETGDWNGTTTTCLIRDCGYPLAPVHGQVQVNKTVYRAEAEYVCHEGFELVGSKTITCGEDGLWSETGHYCTLKDCGIPPPPHNGNISYESTTFGSPARYICFTGYEIKGEDLVVCGADGFWNITGHDCIKKGFSDVTTYGVVGGVTGLIASSGIVFAVLKYWKKIML